MIDRKCLCFFADWSACMKSGILKKDPADRLTVNIPQADHAEPK